MLVLCILKSTLTMHPLDNKHMETLQCCIGEGFKESLVEQIIRERDSVFGEICQELISLIIRMFEQSTWRRKQLPKTNLTVGWKLSVVFLIRLPYLCWKMEKICWIVLEISKRRIYCLNQKFDIMIH